jgi:putative ABC transport system permease protein
VLSISAGFSAVMSGAGSPSRAIILRAGSETELTSAIGGMEVRIIKEAPGIMRDGDTAVATADLLRHHRHSKNQYARVIGHVPMRGIEAEAMKVRSGISLIEGRMFRFGTNEVIVGRAANQQYANTKIGDTIMSGQNRWEVVGVFEADGGLPETEICVTFTACRAFIDGRIPFRRYR